MASISERRGAVQNPGEDFPNWRDRGTSKGGNKNDLKKG